MQFWVSMIAIVIIDQLTKWLITGSFSIGESRALIEGFLYLTYVQNQGAAFGILQGKSIFFLICAGIVIIATLVCNIRHPLPGLARLGMGLLAGGALGNFIDRWRCNFVIDFLDFKWWPVFNIADSAIVCGGILLMGYLLLNKQGEVQK